MTAWGFHGSGMYDYNDDASGAALMVNSIIAIENTPIEFTVYYKWAGINCKNVESPCMVVNQPGDLKPIAIPFQYHAELLAVGTDRISARCQNANVIAARSANNRSMAALVGPQSREDTPSAPLHIQINYMQCAKAGATLKIMSVTDKLAANGAAVTQAETVKGKLTNNYFVADSDGAPYELKGVDYAYAALLILSCDEGNSGPMTSHKSIFV